MTRSNGLLKKALLFIIPILTAASIIGAAFFIFSRNYSVQNFQDSIAQAQAHVRQGEYSDAQRMLSSLSPQNAHQTLVLLKTAYVLGNQNTNYRTMYEIAETGYDTYPGNRAIGALYAYSAVLNSRPESAFEVLEQHSDSLDLHPVFALAAVHSETDISGDLSSPYGALLSSVLSPNSENLSIAAQEYPNPVLALDTAISYMYEGRPEAAFPWVSRFEQAYPEAASVISYDAGEYTQALEILSDPELQIRDLPGPALLLADTLLKLDNHEEAMSIYEQMRSSYPEFSPVPYINSAVFLHSEGDAENAISVLQSGLEVFPAERSLIIISTKLLLQMELNDEAEMMISDYAESHLHDYTAQLLYLRTRSNAFSPEQYRGELWNLFNNDPGNRQIAEYLFWFLLGIRDFEGLRQGLNIYTNAMDETRWQLKYQAILEAEEGNLPGAIALLEELDTHNATWEIKYNLSLLYCSAGRYERAAELLRNGETIASRTLQTEDLSSVQSTIRTQLGKVLIHTGSSERARSELEYALELDHSNLRARLLLKMLEE
ncbi:MAG: tetratricopeptide repeat protein [Spirochaetia bacterium]